MSAGLRLGYVGVGLMGLPMVERLLGRGHAVTVFDVEPGRCELARAAGASVAAGPAGAAEGAAMVLLNLPTTASVEEVAFGEDGVRRVLHPDRLVVDFSTVPVEAGRGFARRLLEETGCGWVDAPVSGGPAASGAGTLTVMAGGRPGDLARVVPLMADIAGRFTPMGPSGAGLVAKAVNQLIVGCGHAVLAEALVLAEAAGIDAARVPECLAGGHADGALLRTLYPRMQARDFAPRGYVRQLLKDLEMVGALAGALKVPTPMSGEALRLYRELAEAGFGALDTAAVVKLLEREDA